MNKSNKSSSNSLLSFKEIIDFPDILSPSVKIAKEHKILFKNLNQKFLKLISENFFLSY